MRKLDKDIVIITEILLKYLSYRHRVSAALLIKVSTFVVCGERSCNRIYNRYNRKISRPSFDIQLVYCSFLSTVKFVLILSSLVRR